MYIIYSPGFGAGLWGWSKEMREDQEIAKLINDGASTEKVWDMVRAKYPEDEAEGDDTRDYYYIGSQEFKTFPIVPGTGYCVDEYDGSESITTSSRFVVAGE